MVISFSVINYVVSMRCPTGVAQLIFFVLYPTVNIIRGQEYYLFLAAKCFLVLIVRAVGFSCLVEECLHCRILVSELSDGQVFCLIVCKTEVVL